ncbi:MAG: MogA/MoaB family molybdenum cofactor biosynthesis protein [Candidatus Koribacter versatilis]|uniref:Molybdopterin adenylyltransferase n=1 Tax=Candidatus Korobacter versatilis TaxID=658062 RepID=A0A932A9W3_9BACT|nr:MogA/MoaB family molybdenum cofactor biosynthesis protein [Candidatus Koribacter versatilis]
MTAAVLTISDSTHRGERKDLSGPAVVALLKKKGFQVVTAGVVSDDQPKIEHALRRLAAGAQLVVTTGGTGIAARDVTPEATRAVCERVIEGLAERMRAQGARQTKFAALSRGVCGTLGQSLIVNLPGNPKAAKESLAAVLGLVPHALDLLAGKTGH